MSQSSNYNCISADCARVVYREYLPPVIRWRYPNEEWQEIEADNYAIERETGQCFLNYKITGSFVTQGGRWNCGQELKFTTRDNAPGQIVSVEIIEENFRGITALVVSKDQQGIISERNILLWLDNKSTNIFLTYYFTCYKQFINRNLASVIDWQIEAVNGVDDCGKCIFTITKNGEIIHEETRNICPEVEKLPCRLSEISKEIKIDKTPFLSAIEVTQIDNDAERIKGVPFPLQGVGKAPDECWNIYRNEIFDPFPSGDADDPNEPAFGDFISQICSAFSCPPPEYEVICNCNEQCPNGTCGVFCGEYLCCYDSTGKSVKAIHYTDIPDFGIPDNTVGINDLGGNFA